MCGAVCGGGLCVGVWVCVYVEEAEGRERSNSPPTMLSKLYSVMSTHPGTWAFQALTPGRDSFPLLLTESHISPEAGNPE